MARHIRVDDEVYKWIISHPWSTGDAINDILRRIAGLPPIDKRHKWQKLLGDPRKGESGDGAAHE